MPLPQGRNYGVYSANVPFGDGDYRLKSVASIAANATATQASGTRINNEINQVSTAGSAYSVTLPVATPGMQITVISTHASNTVAVFPNVGDQINAIAANSGITLAAATSAIFSCATLGHWYTTPLLPS